MRRAFSLPENLPPRAREDESQERYIIAALKVRYWIIRICQVNIRFSMTLQSCKSDASQIHSYARNIIRSMEI
jgi:hypothetical protein